MGKSTVGNMIWTGYWCLPEAWSARRQAAWQPSTDNSVDEKQINCKSC